MISTRTIFVLLILTLVSLAPAAAADWSDIYAQRASAVPIVEIGNGQDGGHCAGVVINAADGYVLTAAHCVVDDTPGYSYTVDKRDGTVVRVNHVLDLAVIKTRLRKGTATLPLASTFPRVGSSVAVLGYPFGARTLTIQVGILANPDVDGYAWMNADLLPGDSGGAIVNDRGELVAVTCGYLYSGPAHIGRAVALETLRDFVEDLLPAPPANK